MNKLVRFVIVLALSVWTTSALAGVNLFITENFGSPYYFASTVRNLGDYEERYKTTCEYQNKYGNKHTLPCTKKVPMNDNMRAIELLDDNSTVEVYEHKNFGGRHIVFRGKGRYVFPAWFWDKASSLSIY